MLAVLCNISSAQTNPIQPGAAVVTANDKGAHFFTKSGRPLEDIAYSLAGEHGWILDYEDALYEDSSAFEDTATPQGRAKNGGKGWLEAKSRTFDHQTSLPLEDSMNHAGDVLKQIVEHYNAGDPPDRFQVIQETSGRLSIVGIAGRDEHGVLIPREPVLNFPVQLKPEKQSILTALTSLTDQLTKLFGHSVVIGTAPDNLLHMTICVPPAGAQSARYDLAAVLDQAPIKLAWELMYDRNMDFDVLNITEVGHYETDARGIKRPVPLRNPK